MRATTSPQPAGAERVAKNQSASCVEAHRAIHPRATGAVFERSTGTFAPPLTFEIQGMLLFQECPFSHFERPTFSLHRRAERAHDHTRDTLSFHSDSPLEHGYSQALH